jgi:hypothetical protein
MTAIINGSSPSVTFSDGTTQATSAIVSGYVPYANLPAGSTLQVVQALLSTDVSTTGTTYVTSGLVGTITPKFSTSKILVTVSGGGSYGNTANVYGENVLYRNGSQISANGVDWAFYSSAATGSNHSYMYLDSPATTSATTYTPYFRRGTTGGAGTYYFNLTQSTGPTVTITLMEIAA